MWIKESNKQKIQKNIFISNWRFCFTQCKFRTWRRSSAPAIERGYIRVNSEGDTTIAFDCLTTPNLLHKSNRFIYIDLSRHFLNPYMDRPDDNRKNVEAFETSKLCFIKYNLYAAKLDFSKYNTTSNTYK